MKGHCNCHAIEFEVHADPQGASMCHCGQCRRQSGGVWASAYVSDDALSISGSVRWFQSSKNAKRGFCPECGSFLFWKALDEDTTSFALGALENPTGLRIEKHIFVGDKGDYYQITDGVEQRQ
ncbi:GFA family protein [Shimia biformata]|uniref:GFA family protein n=1 Tax=Shimia biformata TaxID=1294299 RepID=UPI001EF2D14C|nr:GFA family protein [Shimia biformata]